jgi:4-hydroxy-tetrahydrodipicolinate synthase
MLTGSIVALITPFDQNEEIDFLSLSRLLDFHLQAKTNAILFNGTTGESPTITLDEFVAIGEFVVEKVGGRIPVMAGIGGNCTKEVIKKAMIAESIGVDYLLAVSPSYSKPTNNGILHYYSSISNASSLPIIMYNVPGRTATNITVDIIIEIARRFENIIGIKEASGNIERYMDIINRVPPGFSVYAGDDSLALCAIIMGGKGCISVVANEIPSEFATMIDLALNNKIDEAREIHYKFLPLMQANFIETNPIPVKTALSRMGFCENVFRSPLCKMEIQNQEPFLQLLESYNLMESRILAIA